MFDFLTPEIFDILVIGNLIVGVLLVGFRFYREMTREIPEYNETSPSSQSSSDSASSSN